MTRAVIMSVICNNSSHLKIRIAMLTPKRDTSEDGE
jgi:hypothetical protein